MAMNLTKLFHWFLALSVFWLFAYKFVYQVKDAAIVAYHNYQLSKNAVEYYNALMAARETAMQTGKQSNFYFGTTGWTVDDGKLTKFTGNWDNGVRIGTNIQDGLIIFDKNGNCIIGQNTGCNVHEVAVTSEGAQRIYTVFFEKSGNPIIEYDDF